MSSDHISLVRDQPSDWTRIRLDQAFSLAALGAQTFGAKSKDTAAQKDDVLIQISGRHGALSGQVTARSFSQDETFTLERSMVLLRPNGSCRSDFLVALLSLPAVGRSLTDWMQRRSHSIIGPGWSDLRAFEFAVPEAAIQDTLMEAVQVSAGWLTQHVNVSRRQADIMEELGHAITGEILTGKADRKQALLWIKEGMGPALRLTSAANTSVALPPVVRAEEIDRNGGQSYVALTDHLAVVRQLQEALRQRALPGDDTLDAPALPEPVERKRPGV